MRAFQALAIAIALIGSAPAMAQAGTPPATAAPDATRLAAAQALIARIMPPERIDAMVDQTIRPMMANLRQAMASAPEMQQAFASDPKAKGALDGFIDSELERSVALTKEWMPAMLDAMARAYARRFTLVQLREIDAFFMTPAGKAYAEQGSTIMADPDVLAAQRTMMTKAMDGIQQRAAAMAATLAEQQEAK
jgi:hypothetical protein